MEESSEHRYQVRRNVGRGLCVNAASLAVVAAAIVLLRAHGGDEPYMRCGPHEDLVVLGIAVDTWSRWWGVVGMLSITGAAEVYSSEVYINIISSLSLIYSNLNY